ncbi:MAG TPA: hypothetical protein PKA64_02740, partial [Myxococcota bacterium]|nr:hypothetical protein [Myxococcota bacterium]
GSPGAGGAQQQPRVQPTGPAPQAVREHAHPGSGGTVPNTANPGEAVPIEGDSKAEDAPKPIPQKHTPGGSNLPRGGAGGGGPGAPGGVRRGGRPTGKKADGKDEEG